MLSQTLNYIDWQTFAACVGILAAVLLMVAWQNKMSTERGARWANHSALSLEVLGLSLSVFWAINAPEGEILPIIFVTGWIGMMIGRAVAVYKLIAAINDRRYGQAVLLAASILIGYLALYGSGLFHALNASGDAAQARLEASAPAQALDAQIATTQQQIAALAAFADASRAHAEETAQQQAMQDALAQRNQLSAELAAARETLAACPSGYVTKCIKPARANIASLEAQINNVQLNTLGTGYAAKHAEYIGLQNHLTKLRNDRAAMTANGQGNQSAWRPEDVFLGDLFGISSQQANNIKWLLFTAIFDVLSLLLRVVAAMTLNKPTAENEARRKFNGLLDSGFSLNEALSMMTGQANSTAAGMPVAKVQPHGAAVAGLLTGGRVLSDGLVNMHAGEMVLNPGAALEMEALHPGLVESLNRKHNADAPSAITPNAVTPSAGTPSAGTPSAGTPSAVIYKDLERVPKELSQRTGRGRVGKVDSCKDCGEDFQVLSHNATRCPKCSETNKETYSLRRNKGKK